MTEIQKFYNGESIFITGGTGFLGKILIEKLLRSCPEIKTIYILIRTKKGKTILERMHEMINLPMFEPLRTINPNFEKKIVPLSGDLMNPGLGLSLADRELIMKEVSIVFHTAAATRFDESLKIALKMNVESVKAIIDICKGCRNMKAFIHVSTAFSHCIYDHIEEKVYPAPLSIEDLSEVVKIIEHRNFSEKEEKQFTNLIIGKFPNTYCLTKAIAEELVSKNAKDLPVSIYRFSIAMSSLREPVPGWVDTAQAFSQALIKILRGFIRVLCVNGDFNMETVPIDLTCNCLIASGYETGISKKKFLTEFQRGSKLSLNIRFFTNGKWLFETENVKSLWNKLSDKDKTLFNFDITSFTWHEMLTVHWFGLKKYFLHEEMNLEIQKKSAKKIKRLFYIHQVFRATFYTLLLWFFWKMYCLFFN